MENSEIQIVLPVQFTRKESKSFLQMVRDKLGAGPTELTFDASRLEFIDSSGIGALVEALRQVRENGGDAVVTGLHGEARNFFRSTSLDRLFHLRDGNQVQRAAEHLFGNNAVNIKFDMTLEQCGNACIVRLSGLMDLPNGTRRFKEKMLLAMTAYHQFILEMTSLTYLDSMSISALVSLAQILRSSGGKLRICAPNALVSEMFQNLNLQTLIPVFDTLDQALADV